MIILFSGLCSIMIAPPLKWAKEHSWTVKSLFNDKMPVVIEFWIVSPLKQQWVISIEELG